MSRHQVLEIGIDTMAEDSEKSVADLIDLIFFARGSDPAWRCAIDFSRSGSGLTAMGNLESIFVKRFAHILVSIPAVSGVSRPVDIEIDLPEMRKKFIDELNFLQLINEECDILHELCRHIVMEDIHINHMAPTCQIRRLVFLFLNIFADSCQDERTRVNSFKITPWHL